MSQAPAPPTAALTHLHRHGAPHWGVLGYRILLTGLAAVGVLLLHGFHDLPLPGWLRPQVSPAAFILGVRGAQAALLAAYFLDVLRRPRRGEAPEAHDRVDWVDWGLLALIGGAAGLGLLLPEAAVAFDLGILLTLVVEFWRLFVTMARHSRPGLALPVSFLVLMAAGTPLLKLPVALEPGHTLTWLDALFTATSAVCVTGLVVHTTAEHFTPIGQAILGVLIQLGGLGIIIFGSMLAVLLGRNMSLREHLSLSQMMDDLPLHRIRTMVRFIVGFTLITELIGAAMLYPMWDASVGRAQRLGWSLFHSVSAYCNAGFDLTGNSLVPYRYAMATHLVIGPLIIIGGLGFPVIANLAEVARFRLRRWWRPHRPGVGDVRLAAQRLSLHTKVVLATSAALYLAGFAVFAAGQAVPYFHAALNQGVTAHADRPGSLGAGAALRIVADASFQSITARTAGYNSLPIDEIQPAGRFALTTLMLVGGSPGGTAGGAKTTVIAILVLSVMATVRQKRETEAFGRAISDGLVRKAGTVFICYVGLAVVGTLLLTFSEPFPFEKLLFEVVSAVATVGMSLGITPELSSMGKIVVIVLMFLGRVGPLALLGAVLIGGPGRRPYQYPHETIAIG